MLASLVTLTLLAAPKYPGVDAKTLAQLRTTKQDVFLPTYMPSGMKAEAHVELNAQRDLVNYTLSYTGGGRSFTVQTANEGIGDVFLEDNDGNILEGALTSVRSASFGKIEVEYQKGKAKPAFIVNWIERKKAWPHYVAFLGGGMDMTTVKKILASVRKA